MYNKYSVAWNLDKLPNCCGVLEAGDFDEFEDGSYYPPNPGQFPNLEMAWEKALEQMRKDGYKRPIIFNFVRNKGSRTWSEASLRNLVIDQNDCWFIHKWTNPGTGNTIEQYLLKNSSTSRRSKKS